MNLHVAYVGVDVYRPTYCSDSEYSNYSESVRGAMAIRAIICSICEFEGRAKTTYTLTYVQGRRRKGKKRRWRWRRKKKRRKRRRPRINQRALHQRRS